MSRFEVFNNLIPYLIFRRRCITSQEGKDSNKKETKNRYKVFNHNSSIILLDNFSRYYAELYQVSGRRVIREKGSIASEC